MEAQRASEAHDITPSFGRRKVASRACVADSKPHIRHFLREALEDLGFIADECDEVGHLREVMAEQVPDLFVLGLSAGGFACKATLETLSRLNYEGKVLVFGPRESPMVTAMLSIGETLGLAMLPLLPTPFNDGDLRNRVATLQPTGTPPHPLVDVAEALHANWLELWYQPKIEVRSLALSGAEALIRMRHPAWGIVPPAHFTPDGDDPHFSALSTFIMSRAAEDWLRFVAEYGNVELAINLPVTFFQHPTAIQHLADRIPKHPAFEGMIVEINGNDLVRQLPLAKQAARQLRMLNIGVSIDDLGADWPMLMAIDDFPFVEIKVNQNFIAGSTDDRSKRTTCHRILELADSFGARTVAKGVETRADFLSAREMGFDIIQGYFFAKPMEARKFARRVLGRPVTMPN
jgi:EAL domain-containing protein (putative c-di-GMP-specific phosphodiesterase class I)